LFIVLSHPALKEPEMFQSAYNPLLHFVATLAPRLKEAVVEWLKSAPLFVPNLILVTMQQCLAINVFFNSAALTTMFRLLLNRYLFIIKQTS